VICAVAGGGRCEVEGGGGVLGARPAHQEAPAPGASAGYLTEGKKKRAWSCLREAYQGVLT
jgi:hypothetical protein